MRWLAVGIFMLAGTWAFGDDAPALPPGLAPSGESSLSSPALPPGLGGAPSEAPALPPGLGEAPAKEGPALPAGLGEEPGLAEKAQPEGPAGLRSKLPPISGFWENRLGFRTQRDPASTADISIGESRLQLRTSKDWSRVGVEFAADTFYSGNLEQFDLDLRRLRLVWRPTDGMDISAGRQVLTWGTGDMLFINDLFPKDWPSFFIGRDVEYLKAPSDAVKAGLYNDFMNIEVVYTPQFDPDRHITGEYVSYWNPLFQRHSGHEDQLDTNPPSTWFTDDEWALRLYRRVGNGELAFYGYSGYWKSPGGQRLVPLQGTFPRLKVYGASFRKPVGKGIVNIEAGYYDSVQDPRGAMAFINNSEFRVLVGYERELAKEFTGGFQWYLEHMMDYAAYRNTPIIFWVMEPRDQDRHVLTARFTKMLRQQTLTLSLFGYFSPTDMDAYLRPNVAYKVNDNLRVEVGGNVFVGEHDYSFFGQFEDNTNVYVGMRYSF